MPNFPTLATVPSFPLDPDGEIEDAVLRSPFTGGYELTRPKYTRSRRIWGLRYPMLTPADKNTLFTFEQTTLRNGADSFTWTHPVTATAYTVRFAAPIKYHYFDRNKFAVDFSLREV